MPTRPASLGHTLCHSAHLALWPFGSALLAKGLLPHGYDKNQPEPKICLQFSHWTFIFVIIVYFFLYFDILVILVCWTIFLVTYKQLYKHWISWSIPLSVGRLVTLCKSTLKGNLTHMRIMLLCKWLCLNHHLPAVHILPSPSNPILHAHLNDPSVFLQVAFLWQLSLRSHSSISKKKQKKKEKLVIKLDYSYFH